MSVKHVCPNCGSTLTLDAPMPSLRCPKCRGDKLIPLTGRDLTLKEILAP